MTSYGLVEPFTITEAAEMERCPPTIFVDVGGEVVVTDCISDYSLGHDDNGGVYCLVSVAYSALRAYMIPSVRAL